MGAKLARPFVRFVPDARLRAMIKMAPKQIPAVSRNDDPQVFPPETPIKKRVALMTGCAQRALNTDINDATIRVLKRFGCEVVIADGQGCCGALTHHMGKVDESHASAAKNINAWYSEIENGGLDAIVINTSGCGTTVKDYDKEANAILQRVEEGETTVRPSVLFEPGEVVRVIEGPFADFNGVVEEINYEKSRLRVSVLIFGRASPVELEFGQVEKT